jgi:Rrf2 family transcriptional regulator, iron-sulfur cluster assembly transcription factor
MRLSTRARYALKAMMVVAREGKKGTPINIGEIAQLTSLSKRYLEQVSISLKNAGLLRAVSGKKGGHLLSRPAEDIRLLEIVEAAIGPINIVECVGNPLECLQLADCECRSVYVLINGRIREALRAFTLADLSEHRVDEVMKREFGLSPTPCGANQAKQAEPQV